MQAIVKHQAVASSQFLTFLLDEQEYGLELFKIQEIRGYRKRSRINSPGRSAIGESMISRSVRSVGRIVLGSAIIGLPLFELPAPCQYARLTFTGGSPRWPQQPALTTRTSRGTLK
jgi:hypothetical protein